MGIQSDFIEVLRVSINKNNNVDHIEKREDNKLYYTEEYRNALLKNDNYKRALKSSFEMNKTKYGTYPICSWASSGRLCFLDFYNKDGNVKFEKNLKNDIGSTTKIDAYNETSNTYYECKCQEVLSASIEHIRFSINYQKNSNFFKEMNLVGKVIDDKYFVLDIKNICPECKKESFYFDAKQMICHLIALATLDNKTQKILQYVIYKPSFDENKYKKLASIYYELEEEYILLKKRLDNFANNHGITIADNIFFKKIEDIHDFVYTALYKK